MIWRKVEMNRLPKTDVLVFAAHPDDEVLGVSATLMRARNAGKNVTVVYVTDGTGHDWYRQRENAEEIAKTRFNEGIAGLSLIDIDKEHVLTLGFPDKGVHRYLNELTKDVTTIIQKVNPSEIYVHCIEGGHSDHDLTSAVVKFVCKNLNVDSLYEWPEYSTKYPIGSKIVRFLSRQRFHEKESELRLTESELAMKRNMIRKHVSQRDLISNFVVRKEYVRKANQEHVRDELVAYAYAFDTPMKVLVTKYVKQMEKKLNHKQSPITSTEANATKEYKKTTS